MPLEVWLTFVFTATLILVIPGPTIIYVVGQSLAHGRKAGIPLSIGVLLGDAVCITLSLLGLSALLSVCAAAFMAVKYLGAAYLIYLGVKMIRTRLRFNTRPISVTRFNSTILARDVFWVNALNPKGIIFFSAFMPQFVSTQNSIIIQLVILAVTFLGLAFINVSFYSLLASKVSEGFRSARFTDAFNWTGGVSLICAGVCSLTIEKR